MALDDENSFRALEQKKFRVWEEIELDEADNDNSGKHERGARHPACVLSFQFAVLSLFL